MTEPLTVDELERWLLVLLLLIGGCAPGYVAKGRLGQPDWRSWTVTQIEGRTLKQKCELDGHVVDCEVLFALHRKYGVTK